MQIYNYPNIIALVTEVWHLNNERESHTSYARISSLIVHVELLRETRNNKNRIKGSCS